MTRGRRRQEGQATVELVAMIPLLVVVVMAAAQLLAAGAAHAYAGHAAEAGAIALLEGGDPRAAARSAIPGWSHSQLSVAVRSETVHVAVRPQALIPPLAGLLTARADARAGA